MLKVVLKVACGCLKLLMAGFCTGLHESKNHERSSEFGIEPSVGQVLSDEHGVVGVALKDDAMRLFP